MLTKLDILNAMLAVNGEAPVSSLASTDPAAIQALNKLDELDYDIQARGWYFNKEVITVQANSAGEVVLPQNTLCADPVDANSEYVARGTKLYDKENNTYIIDEDVDCLVVLQLDLTEAPAVFKSYLKAKAVKEYYMDDDGDDAKIRWLEKREAETFAYLQRAELKSADTNIRRSPLGARLLRETVNYGNYYNG